MTTSHKREHIIQVKDDEGCDIDSQFFQGGLNVGKFKEDRSIGNALVVEHQANTPDDWREA